MSTTDPLREALERIATQGTGRMGRLTDESDAVLVSDDGRWPWLHWGEIAREALTAVPEAPAPNPPDVMRALGHIAGQWYARRLDGERFGCSCPEAAREALTAVPVEPEHDADKPACPTCGLIYDQDSAGAECERLETDQLEIHDALVSRGLDGAINAQSIIERIESLRPVEPEAWEWRAGYGTRCSKPRSTEQGAREGCLYGYGRAPEWIERRTAPGKWERVDPEPRPAGDSITTGQTPSPAAVEMVDQVMEAARQDAKRLSERQPRLQDGRRVMVGCTCVGTCDRRSDGICRCLPEPGRPAPDEPSEQAVPFFDEAARETAGFALFASNYSGECAREVWDNPDRPWRRREYTAKAQPILAAALKGLPPRSILELARLSDEELVERVKRAIDVAVGGALDDDELEFYARVPLAALGLPVNEQEETGHSCDAELKARPDYSVGHGTPDDYRCSCGTRFVYVVEESEGAWWEPVVEEPIGGEG